MMRIFSILPLFGMLCFTLAVLSVDTARAQQTGVVYITSNPDSAAVWLNNRILGYTPYRLIREPGTVQLSIRKRGYRNSTIRLAIEEGAFLERFVDLRNRSGTFGITNDYAGARIYEGDQLLGIAPMEASRPRGTFTFRAEKECYPSQTRQLDIKSGQTTYWDAPLRQDIILSSETPAFIQRVQFCQTDRDVIATFTLLGEFGEKYDITASLRDPTGQAISSQELLLSREGIADGTNSSLHFVLSSDASLDRPYQLLVTVRLTPPPSFLLRALVPGMGQFNEGAKHRGQFFLAGTVVTLASFGILTWFHQSAVDDANNAAALYRSEVEGLDDLQSFTDEDGNIILSSYQDWVDEHDHAQNLKLGRDVSAGLALAFWTTNLIDNFYLQDRPALLSTPSVNVGFPRIGAGYIGSQPSFHLSTRITF